MVTFRTNQGVDIRATLLRLNRYGAAFEVYALDLVLRSSEVLSDFRIFVKDQVAYSGRAVVNDVIHTGTVVICSVLLDEASFDADFFTIHDPKQLSQKFDEFLSEWQSVCRVSPEIKVALADVQTFLIDLRRCLEQVEIGIRSTPTLNAVEQERAAIDALAPGVVKMLDALFYRFESLTATVKPEDVPLYRSYAQRLLHPIVLCAPFAYRSFVKPLGFAGDYEMVNMMARDPREGSSLFAKVFNVWLLHQSSAAAHRNRIQWLTERLVEESATAVRHGRKARVLSLGCGPALEVQRFMAESSLSNHAEFTLLDFNDETLEHLNVALSEKRRQHARDTSFTLVKKSVQQLLKDVARGDGLSRGKKYDFIYCAGLFDYLPDITCKRILSLCYQSLAPGGLTLATNVAPHSPNRGSLELILDWQLIYRDADKVRTFRPEGVMPEDMAVQIDGTGINVFLEARKPNGN